MTIKESRKITRIIKRNTCKDLQLYPAEARVRDSVQNATKFMLKRDIRACRKAALEMYLSAMDCLHCFPLLTAVKIC